MNVELWWNCRACGGTSFFIRKWTMGVDGEPDVFTGAECDNPACAIYRVNDVSGPPAAGEP